jgi:hypothetical protein
MSLTTLAIQTEAWLQEELQSERALLELLQRMEAAARRGSGDELARCALEVTTQLDGGTARHVRRTTLFARLAAALAVPVQSLTLTRLAAKLRSERIETARLEVLRDELRAATSEALRASRRLAAMAQYHRGLLEELCQLLQGEAPRSDGHLVDARG